MTLETDVVFICEGDIALFSKVKISIKEEKRRKVYNLG
jgi:hypothetical protein